MCKKAPQRMLRVSANSPEQNLMTALPLKPEAAAAPENTSSSF